MGTFFESGKDKEAKKGRRGMGSAFQQLCAQVKYSETSPPLPLRLLGFGIPLLFYDFFL